MNTLVVFDSQCRNTGQIVQTIVGTLSKSGRARAIDVSQVGHLDLEGVDVLIVGCATRRGKPTLAIQAFLDNIPDDKLDGLSVAGFDTSFPLPRLLGGSGAHKMAQRLRRREQGTLVPPTNFFVAGRRHAVKNGKVARAERWAHTVRKMHRAQQLFCRQ
jgi:flavodoxin